MATHRNTESLTPQPRVRFPSFLFIFGGAVVRHPGLWATALRQLMRAMPTRWWRRPPFLPIPDAAYLRYRVDTAYGTAGVPVHGEIVSYLRWCRDHDRARTAEH